MVCALSVLGCHRQPPAPQTAPPLAQQPATAPKAAAEESTVLYFPGTDGLLHREARDLVLQGAADERTRQVVAALLAGPADAALAPPFPEGVAIGDVFLTADGVVFVDLSAPEQPNPPASGSQVELQRVFSLVDSILIDVPEVTAVALLWNGRQRPSFAGHVDTGHALTADRRLIATGGP